jgi:hypothetical protein
MTTLRRNRRSLAALAASMFLAVWASMAIAPCLMAAEAIIGGDCPHCPEPPPPCHDPGGAGVCTYVDGYDFDGRVPAAPKIDVELVLAPPLELIAVSLPVQRSTFMGLAARAPPHPCGPRLHLRNCVLTN